MKHTRLISRAPEMAQSSLQIKTEFLLDTKSWVLDKFPRGGTGGTGGGGDGGDVGN